MPPAAFLALASARVLGTGGGRGAAGSRVHMGRVEQPCCRRHMYVHVMEL